jgi:DNA-binding SARP family transcriptional activator
MIVKKHPSPEPVHPKILSSNSILELINDGKYDEANEHLHQVQLLVDQYSNPMLSSLLVITRSLCSASKRNHEQMEWHRLAIEDTINSEIELNERLLALLGTFDRLIINMENDHTLLEPALNKTLMPASGNNHSANGKLAAKDSRHWRGIRGFLIRDASPSSHDDHTQLANLASDIGSPLTDTLVQSPNSLVVYGLGTFQVYRNNELIENWPNRKGALVLKYLLMNRDRQIHKEMLMDLFWPDSEEEAQRNNLNVVIYGLRQSLRNGDPSFSHVLFQNDCYFLNPELRIWADYETFLEYYQTGRRHEQNNQCADAIRAYEMAETLYQGIFLPEDTYEEWTENLRQNLQSAYLSLLDSLSSHYLDQGDYVHCAATCNKMLEVDSCFEEAHVRLMRCYSRQGQIYLAMRQYDRCVRILEAELDVPPLPETDELYEKLRVGKRL